jgi:mRNA-degrading endonuclease RelE of RelBE toxin-antitoxin system
MSWSVEVTYRGLRDLGRLDRLVARRVVAKLERATGDPHRFFSRIVSSDDYKLRVGDYRVLAGLVPETKTILVKRVDHRSRIYER